MQQTRRHAREVAMQALHWLDVNPSSDISRVRRFVRDRLHFDALEEFAWTRIEGVRNNLEQIDALLGSVSEHWSVARMAVVDRNVLRLAVYELWFEHDIPPKVVIDEALELSKRYSNQASVAFVNGVLDRIANLRRSADAIKGPVSANELCEDPH
jgi:N utilization substance protein B